MITADVEGLKEFCKRDVFGTRISALFDTYGNRFDDVLFWVQTNGDRVVAAVCSCFGNMTVSCAEEADIEELDAFIGAVGARSLLCEKGLRAELRIKPSKSGFVVVRKESGSVENFEYISSDSAEFSYKDIYGILMRCGFDTGEYGDWLADISMRVRRGTAEIKAISDGEKYISCVSSLFVTDTAVLLGAVGTLSEHRGEGLAGRLVLLSSDEVIKSNRRAELLCEPHRLSFYEKLGFRVDGEWSQ